MRLKLAFWACFVILSIIVSGHNSNTNYEKEIVSLKIKKSDTREIMLLEPAGPFCITDAAVNLEASIPDGTWSGEGITDAVNGIFDPSVAGAGDHTITYVSTGGTETTTIHVDATVDATITPAGPFCETDGGVILTAASPGGPWSGAGIVDQYLGTFYPSIAGPGDHIVSYNVENGLCSDSDNITITVVDMAVNATITPAGPFCENDQPIILNAAVSGGFWSGTGIIDPVAGIFDPSVAGIGMHVITYSVEFGDCSGTAQTVINVTGINVFGYLYSDLNANCIFDEGEAIPNRLIYANPGPFYDYTDQDGKYNFFLDEGAYTVHAAPLDYYGTTCPESGFQNITIENIEDTLQNINLGLSQTFLCPLLDVSVSSGAIRPCFNSSIYIHYSRVKFILMC